MQSLFVTLVVPIYLDALTEDYIFDKLYLPQSEGAPVRQQKQRCRNTIALSALNAIKDLQNVLEAPRRAYEHEYY